MIELHIQEFGKFWCSTALRSGKIFATTFAVDKRYARESLVKELLHHSDYHIVREGNSLGEEVLNVVGDMLQGKDVSFSFQFDMARLSDYSQKVLGLTSLIPTGYVVTYGDLAKVAGGSPRSVGRVMATNPFAPIIPCHRVVAADMTLGGYGGGLKMKWRILQKENRNYKKVFKFKANEKAMRLYPICLLRTRDNSLDSVINLKGSSL